MDRLANDYPDVLLTAREAPCLSLYQPTHRTHPDNLQDPIRFGNLLKTLLRSLEQRYSGRDIKALLKPLYALADDAEFWNQSLDGLAVLVAAGFFRVYKLQRPVRELAVAGDSFHTKPLVRIMQSADHFQILGLNRGGARLFEGNRDHVDEVDLAPELRSAMDEALARDVQRGHATRTYGPVRDGSMARHGQGNAKQDAIRADTEQFFRAVDRGVLEYHSRPADLPLLLAALPEHSQLFRAVSRNPRLLDAGIDVRPDDLTLDALRQRAWDQVQPHYLARLAAIVDRFEQQRPREQATADLATAARAAVAGRIDTLLLDAEARTPGRMDSSSGAITLGTPDDPQMDDLLDDLGEQVLTSGGDVVVVPAERMPTDSGLAAIYRF